MLGQMVQTRRWTRQEYDKMVAAGIFHAEERLELVEGEIIAMTPQGSGHATAVSLVEEVLRNVMCPGYTVRVQMPLALGAESEPEPDVAMVAGSPRDYRDEHPHAAVLVVEVADSTLAFDRQRKASLYARAGIQECWIVNLIDRCVEIYRDPSPAGSQTAHYQSVRVAHVSEAVSLLTRPDTSIPIADLLP
jgi:Uma2 family endonuclease